MLIFAAVAMTEALSHSAAFLRHSSARLLIPLKRSNECHVPACEHRAERNSREAYWLGEWWSVGKRDGGCGTGDFARPAPHFNGMTRRRSNGLSRATLACLTALS